MFTGIIETTGEITDSFSKGTNTTYWISSPISDELKVDQSVSHNGVCLTVEEVAQGRHRVTAIAETLLKTNLGHWKPGHLVNIERCLPLNGRLDGHLVQGHVDATGLCIGRAALQGSYEFSFNFPDQFASLIIEKGSICLNGISLTVFNVGRNEFTVAIIPYTFEHTNIKNIQPGDAVNLEFDLIGKYINRMAWLKS
jgi:riboflavin synthase